MCLETLRLILNAELSVIRDDSPISSIHSRLKKPASIYGKLIRQGNEISLRSVEENLNDVAGIRVICACRGLGQGRALGGVAVLP